MPSRFHAPPTTGARPLLQDDDPSTRLGGRPYLNEGVLLARPAAAALVRDVSAHLEHRFTTGSCDGRPRFLRCLFPQAVMNERLVDPNRSVWRRRSAGEPWAGRVGDVRVATFPTSFVARLCAHVEPRDRIVALARSVSDGCRLAPTQMGLHAQMVRADSRIAAFEAIRGNFSGARRPVALSSTHSAHVCVCVPGGCHTLQEAEARALHLSRCRTFRPDL